MRRTLARALTALAGCSAAVLPAALIPAATAAPPALGPSAAPAAGFGWSALASSPLGARSGPLVAWAGGQLLEIGGLVANGSRSTSAGAAFDPATGRWRRIAAVPAAAGVRPNDPTGLSLSPDSAWTGKYLAVANGLVKACPKADPTVATACWTGVALYDPAANRWTALTLPKQLDGLEVSAVAWTGRDVVVAAVDTAAFGTSQGRLAMAAYAVATHRWRVITPVVPRRHPPRYLTLTDADGQLLLWSQWDRVIKSNNGFGDYAGVDVLAMSSNGTWRNVTGRWPQEQNVSPPLITADGLLFSPGQIWCGVACIPPYSSEPGYFANPVTLARKTIPAGPLGQSDPPYVWAGDEIIAVNQNVGDVALFKPSASRWTPLPAVPGHPSLSVTPVWTGTELLTLTNAGRLLALHD